MINLKNLKWVVSTIAALLLFGSASFAAGQNTVQGIHETLDPNSRTDDLGITIPIPISHPGRRYPATDDFPTGPDLGERLPDFTLQNQHGELVDFSASRADSRAVVVFYRSAVW
ncbi:MAG TPA: hypothetical protein EYQ00_06770 [Dehalococcoidia bacterium]|nr:hypothetical protein [Dehalococcoidia bacterium]